MKKVAATILLVVGLLALGVVGYGYYLLSELEQRFPPVSFDKAQRRAVEQSSVDLPTLSKRVDFLLASPVETLLDAAGLRAVTVIPINDTSLVKISDIHVSMADQAIKINAAFSAESNSPNLIATGQLSLFAFPSLGRGSDQSLSLRLQVAEPQIEFKSVRVRSFSSPQLLLGVMSEAANRASAVLVSKISSQKKVIEAQMPSRTTKVKIGEQERTIPIPALKVAAGTVLVDKDAIVVLVRTAIGAEQIESPPTETETSFKKFRTQVNELTRKYFREIPLPIKQPISGVSSAFMTEFLRESPNETTETILENARRVLSNDLEQTDRFDVGVFVPAEMVLSTIKREISARQAELTSNDPLRSLEVNVNLEPQALRVSAVADQVRIDKATTLSGNLTALLVPVGTSDGIEIRTALTEFSVDSAWIEGWGISTTFVELLTTGAGGVLAEKLNALIPPYVVAIPTLEPKPMPLAPQKGPVSVSYEASSIKIRPIKGAQSTVLLEPTGLSAAFRAPGISPTKSTTVPTSQTNSADTAQTSVARRFKEKWIESFGALEDKTSAYLRRGFVADFINAIFEDNPLVANVTAQQTDSIKPVKARLGKVADDFECSRRSCSRGACNLRRCTYNNSECGRRTSCSRSPGECAFNCTREVSYKCIGSLTDPVRTCTVKIDDPACVARKAACNLAAETRVTQCNVTEEARIGACTTRANVEHANCQASATAEQTACNAREEAQLASCNMLAEAELGACNLRKAAIGGLNAIGDVGTVSGETSFDAAATVRLSRLRVDQGFTKIDGSAAAEVKGNARANIAFSPSIGAALIACAPQKLSPKTTLSINQQFDLTGQLSIEEFDVKKENETEAGKRLLISLAMNPFKFNGMIQPSILDALFLNNPDFVVTCPLVGNAALLGNLVGKSVRVLKGGDMAGALVKTRADLGEGSFADIDLANGAAAFSLSVKPVEFSIDNASIKLGATNLKLNPVVRERSIAFVVP